MQLVMWLILCLDGPGRQSQGNTMNMYLPSCNVPPDLHCETMFAVKINHIAASLTTKTAGFCVHQTGNNEVNFTMHTSSALLCGIRCLTVLLHQMIAVLYLRITLGKGQPL